MAIKRLGNLANIILKCMFFLIFAFPFLWMVLSSLKSYKEITQFPPTLLPDALMFSNYVRAWTSAPFLTFLMNSVIVTVVTLILQVIIMVPTAYALAKCNFIGKRILFGIILIAFMLPEQITFIPVYFLFVEWGMLDSLLPQILPFIANPFGIFLLRQYFMQIPEEIIEASQLDNAGRWKTMYKIMLPMSKGVMATILIFSVVKSWNAYFWPMVMTSTASFRPLTVGIAMLSNSEGIINWHVIMAANVILVLPILLIYLLSSGVMTKAMVYSGIK